MLARGRVCLKQALLGFAYGCALTVFGFLAAGYGHGTYTLLALASSPAGVVGLPGMLLLGPALWAFVGWLLSRRDRRKTMFLVVMLLHYAGAVYLLTSSQFADWEIVAGNWERIRFAAVGSYCWYVAGQIVIWITFFMPVRRRQEA